MEFLRQTVFSNKLNEDLREPEFVFSAPVVGEVGLTGLEATFWIQLISVLLLQTILNVVISLVVYKYIVRRQGSMSSYLLGYGCICPLLVYIPFIVIAQLDLRNKAFLIGAASGPTLLFFRCLEAMHGITPTFATKSASRFILYYAATVQFEFDAKTNETIPITKRYVLAQVVKFTKLFVQTALLFSLLVPCDYSLFSRGRQRDVPLDLLHGGHLINNLIMAHLSATCLDVGATGIGLATSLVSGLCTVSLNDAPLTASASPSEFWGKRWNTLVSSALKRGVFRPFRKYRYSRSVAAIATFTASGLLHEYLILVMILGNRDGRLSTWDEDGPALFGKHLLFFVWNAVVLILEDLFKNSSPVRWIVTNMPRLIRTQLVVMTVLPLAHLFTGVYVDMGFYSDFAIGFPRLVKVDAGK